MTENVVIEPAIDPNNRITFLLDWELTMKCNLNCSYCPPGLYSGHDNTTKHPNITQCLKTIDFMYEYVDIYMQQRPQALKHVVLNVYGGEALHHPNIVEILQQCRKKHASYNNKWSLTITTTTNAIISQSKLLKIIPLVDEFTCSYHSECTEKQKSQFKENLLLIQVANRRLKCVVLMHADEDLFNDSQSMIEWCNQQSIKYLPRQLDHNDTIKDFNYSGKQVTWFKSMYEAKQYNTELNFTPKSVDDKYDLAATGRACCGGRQLCVNNNQKSRSFFVDNKFTDWYCSVNHFFLYVKQITGEIFVNKDCMMNFDNEVGPIGHLNNTAQLINKTQQSLTLNQLPVIQCKKSRCLCGLCAPKAKDLNNYTSIMRKYTK